MTRLHVTFAIALLSFLTEVVAGALAAEVRIDEGAAVQRTGGSVIHPDLTEGRAGLVRHSP